MSESFKIGAEAPESEALPQNQEFPDGIGIKLEDMNVLLFQKHDTTLDKNDPALILVSICNSFLGEVQHLQQRHNEALSRIITGRTKAYVQAVRETTESFGQAVSSASVEGIRKIFDRHTAALQASVWNIRWCALIAAASALLNLYALLGR
jgi:hypothetical protein